MAITNIDDWPPILAAGITSSDKIAMHTAADLHVAATMNEISNYHAAYGRFFGIDVLQDYIDATPIPGNNVIHKISFLTTVTDTTGGWNSSNEWTCPRTGYWLLNVRMLATEMTMPGGNQDFRLGLGVFRGSTLIESQAVALGSRDLDVPDVGATLSLTAVYPLAVGDVLSCGLSNSATSDLILTAEEIRFTVSSLGAAVGVIS